MGSTDDKSVSMRWLEMFEPPDPNPTQNGNAGSTADSKTDAPVNYSLKVIEEPANVFVRKIQDPLNLVSIMGPARSGKSTLMNLLAGCKDSELFVTAPGMDTFTKGVFIPTKLLTLPQFASLDGGVSSQDNANNIKVSFVDTEGQGAFGDAYDLNLFSPGLITSRVVIYNRTGGLLAADILQQLGMMVNAAQRVRKAKSTATDPEANSFAFGHLVIIFNRYSNPAEGETPEKIQDKLFAAEKGRDSATKTRNEVRVMLKAVFESIRVLVLRDDLKPSSIAEQKAGTKKFLLLDDFGNNYQDDFKILRSHLSNVLVSPRELSAGVSLSGGSIADFMPDLAHAINTAEPLNVGNIFETSQYTAINKAVAVFTTSIGSIADNHLKQDPKSTTTLSSEFDQELNACLGRLSSDIAYMPPEKVKKVVGEQKDASGVAKANVLAANLVRLKALVSVALTKELEKLTDAVSTQFPTDSTLTISQKEMDERLAAISRSAIASVKNQGSQLDENAIPSDLESSINKALDGYKAVVSERIMAAWSQWTTKLRLESFKTLTTDLGALGTKTNTGDLTKYNSGREDILSGQVQAFGQALDNGYFGVDKVAQKQAFETEARQRADLSKAQWQKDDTDIQEQLKKKVAALGQRYSNALTDALAPNVEPPSFDSAVSPQSYKNELEAFCTLHRIVGSLKDEVTLNFNTTCSAAKTTFSQAWNNACAQFQKSITGTFDLEIPLLIKGFYEQINKIDMNIDSAAVTRTSIEGQCNSIKTKTEEKFTQRLSGMNVKADGPVSPSIIASRRSSLDEELKTGVSKKIGSYDEIVAMYNKAALTTIIVPVIDQAMDNKYVNLDVLRQAIDDAHKAFESKKRGDGTDSTNQWQSFEQKTVPLLEEHVTRSNGFNVTGLGPASATREVQRYVIKNIYKACANIGNCFNMSYISGSSFNENEIQEITDPDKIKEDRGGAPDRKPSGKEIDRIFRMMNDKDDSDPNNHYQWWRATSLEFFEWTVEISDMDWGKPIVTDMKPLQVNSAEYTAGPEGLNVKVGHSGTETSTVTNTKSFGWGIGGEASYEWGVKDVSKTTIKGSFNLKWDESNTQTATNTFTATMETTVPLPPNRTSVIQQLIFDQRTTIPYTAKVKVVPRFRLWNGFTNWGDGGSYKKNARTGALKDGYKDGDRTFRNFTFRRCDQIYREDANNNADPWEWKLCMERNPDLTTTLEFLASNEPYTTYVKGKWEGVSGKYSVVTVQPKQMNLVT